MNKFELSDEEIETFKKIGRIKDLDAGGILFYEDEKADNVYIILSGLVKGGIFENKREKIFHYFFPKMFVGEISFLEKKNYALSAKFVTNGKILVVSRVSLNNFSLSKDELNKIFQRAMISKARFLQKSIRIMTSVNTKVKCAIFLLEYREFLEYISITEMASVLNTTRESISRAISFLIKQKAIKKDKNKITILNEEFLRVFIKAQENDISLI